MNTVYHRQYCAHALSLRGSGGNIASLSRSIANARVDLNPHQIDAALFALRSPLSNGAIFDDEVGLGKTIEAGIVLAQRWAERRRKILIIVPAMLRKQWQLELEQKFYLPCVILDAKSYNHLNKNGAVNPFEQEARVVICSYHFASAKSPEISRVPWDVAVIDEAHRLRNVYRSRNKIDPLARKSMSHKIADALEHVPKLLLTATPLQNSLMELYGLVSVIDRHVFGDSLTFREQFVRISNDALRNEELKQRLEPICIRTLRKQVMEYVPFTRHVPITQEFLPSDAEQELYERASSYLQRESLVALPASQRPLITLILRKLLASSTFAIARTLRRLVRRLENIQEQVDLLDDEDLEGLDELEDEWQEERAEKLRPLQDIDKQIREARKAAALAQSLQDKQEAQKVIKALEKTRNTKRRDLFDAQDAIDEQREELIKSIEKQLKQRRSVKPLFCVRWRIV